MRKNIWFIFLLLLFLASCISKPVAMVEPTAILMPSSTSTAAFVPVPTKTSTPIPTVTSTLAPTWTPLPTLLPETGSKILFGWLEGTNGCRFPCWAGVTPGETTWQEAKQLIEPISGFAKLNIYSNPTCAFDNCNGMELIPPSPINAQIYIGSQSLENKIHLIQMEIGDIYLVKALELRTVLNVYGKPAILKFYADPDQPGEYKDLQLTMVYPEHQFIIKYANNARLVGKNLVSCDSDSVINLLILDNKKQLMSESAIENSVETKNFPVTRVWLKSAEESIGMTTDEFYETFKKPDAPCITTPVEIWMP